MERKKTFGWIELIVGIILVIFGLYTLCNPAAALGGIVFVCGAAALISGIANIAFYIQAERRTGFGPVSSLVGGIISIILGLLLVMNIGIGAMAVSILFPIWFLVHCIARLANLGSVRMWAGNGPYWISLIVNIIGLIFAFLLLIHPFTSVLIIGYIIGFYLLLFGISGIVSAISGYRRSR